MYVFLLFSGLLLSQTGLAEGMSAATTGDRLAAPARDGATLPDFPLALLGSFEFETPSHRFADQWRQVIASVEHERALYEFCAWRSEGCPAALTKWRMQLARIEALPPIEQLRRLNRMVNALVPYASDTEVYGKSDHWASPLEFLQNGGDCEDFAILKFFSLLELGFTDEQMRLVVVRDQPPQRMHAVLLVELADRIYVLDNRFAEPVQHQHLLRYEPLYSANLSRQWVHLVTSEIRRRFVVEMARGRADSRTRTRASAHRPLPEFRVDSLFDGAPASAGNRL